MVAQPPNGTGTAAAGGVPRIEFIRRPPSPFERLGRIDEPRAVGIAQVFAHQGQAQIAREDARTVAQTRRVGQFAEVAVAVEDRARQLGIVRPRPAVQVVRSHGRPRVVDDHGFRVHVDRRALFVLEVEDREPVASEGVETIDELELGEPVGGPESGPLRSGTRARRR